MAHELTIRTNGKAEMAYVGETPWHGLGQSLGRGRTIEEWQQAAGMDWKIARSRVRYGDAANTRIIEDKHVLFRSDTKDALGIVSDKFQIVQPRAVLEFFRDLTAGNGFELETAGTLYGGRRFWAMASIGKAAQIAGVDRVGGYLLLSTGADGTLATSARFTTVRVVCNNTLTMALRKDGRNNTGVASVNHRSGFDADAVKNQLGITRSNMHGIFGELIKPWPLTSRSPCWARTASLSRLSRKSLRAPASRRSSRCSAALAGVRNSPAPMAPPGVG
jgi:phage/plasmid-like protein (TIGR03299 family)